MLAPLVAALACVIATPQSRAADASSAAGASSATNSVAEPLSTPQPELACSFAGDGAFAPGEAPAPVTPLGIECAGAPLPISDWSALVCRSDEGTSCRLLVSGHTRTPVLRARGRAGLHVSAAAIAARPELLLPDAHATPLLWPAHLVLVPSFTVTRLVSAPSQMPPSVPPGPTEPPPRS
jgi:hypothetical protein